MEQTWVTVTVSCGFKLPDNILFKLYSTSPKDREAAFTIEAHGTDEQDVRDQIQQFRETLIDALKGEA